MKKRNTPEPGKLIDPEIFRETLKTAYRHFDKAAHEVRGDDDSEFEELIGKREVVEAIQNFWNGEPVIAKIMPEFLIEFLNDEEKKARIKASPEYQEYLRLKEKFEGVEG